MIEFELTIKSTGKRVRDEGIHLMEFGSDGEMTVFRHFLVFWETITRAREPT